ncbi:DUF4783 domain-containing protein [Fulvivirga lutea]|uniref:DUF4783 domain-containing protein n=1 Tax=Fulvivirga lutea TaxID=2810512 RepID=A0A974WK25_9BACT|nr:DUF4783 domain-containing protein [Fulvivirga lutea]QSE98597.1 DUF4783 domain-containing protein [Fulvivirga lutea]
MKSLKYILLFCLSLVFFSETHAQKETIDDVKNAIKSGSSKEVSKHFDANVDVTIDSDIQTYSKIQAEYVFKDFFKNNPPTSFTIVHQGSSKGGLPYAIGQYISNGQTFRVWMRIKSSGERYLINEISFIKE